MQKHTSVAGDRLRRLISIGGRQADLPVTDSFLLEMADDGVLRITGCRGIELYTPEEITVSTDRFLLTVRGENLFLKSYSETDAAVNGRIETLAFGRERHGG